MHLKSIFRNRSWIQRIDIYWDMRILSHSGIIHPQSTYTPSSNFYW